MAETTQKQGFFGSIMSLPNDNPKKTVFIAIILCLVCSILVSTAAVQLRSKQIANKKNDIRENILTVTGLANNASPKEVADLFKRFEVKLVDLKTGNYVTDSDLNPVTYDQRQAAQNPKMSIKVPSDEDIAKIVRRANIAKVYLLMKDGKIQQVVLPVHGYGLWSTMYGFMALDSDFNTIQGLKFYEQGETPGLGGEVDNPKWRAQWKGKKVFDQDGKVKISVVRGPVDEKSASAKYKIDAISGATLTSRGVSNLVHYWMGPHGFGPYLTQMRSELGN